jgi:cytochrome c oxidase subunit 2
VDAFCTRKGSFVSLQLPQRLRRPALGGVLAVVVLLLSGCSAETEGQIKRLANPVASSKEAELMHSMWMWSWLAAILTGIVVWGLILYASFRFRRRSETEIPVQTRYNLPIEIFYTLAPIMMVIVFFYFTVDTQNKVQHNVGTTQSSYDVKPAESITVVGQQWSWTFNYNLAYDHDKSDYEPVDGKTVVHEGGTTSDRPTLWLVVDKPVKFYLRSPDVIHSFWIPAFLYKMDVVPGRDGLNTFALTPNRKGTFVGRCAELCGVYHSRMLFTVKVVSQSDYDAHLAQLEEKGSTGPALGASEYEKTPGLESGASTGGDQ